MSRKDRRDLAWFSAALVGLPLLMLVVAVH
jgi:hypothetical protein